MSELEYNREKWNQIACRRDEYYLSANEFEIEKARSGQVEIKLTPTKNVPADWLGELNGKEVLALACGGGLQGPLLAAAGASTTVFDLSERQLERDLEVADHFGLSLKTLRGDMADLSQLPDETFDLVINPCSVCFCKSPSVIWREVARVMRPDACFLAGLVNPVNYLFDFFESERNRLIVRHVIPFDSRQLDVEERDRWLGSERPVEYGHSLQQLIAGQLDAGLVLRGFYEDRWGDDDLLCDHLPVFIATRTWRPLTSGLPSSST